MSTPTSRVFQATVRPGMRNSVRGGSCIGVIVTIVAAALVAGCAGAGTSKRTKPASTARTESASSSAADVAPPAPGTAPHGVTGISAPGFPAMIVPGAGSVWVFTHRSSLAHRIDPNTNRIVAAVDLGDTPCTSVAFGGGLVWSSNCGPGEGSKGISFGIDPKTDRVARRVRGTYPTFGDGSLWVLDDSGEFIRRVDPQSGVVLASIATRSDQQPGGGTLTIGGVSYGSVWLASDEDKTVTRISTATNKVTRVIPLVGSKTQDEEFPTSSGYIDGAQMAFADGRAWYGNPAGLFEIDARTNHATLIPLHMQPFTDWGDIPVVSAAGSIWLRTADATIDRVDPATGRGLTTYPADRGGGGGGVAVAFGSLWVDNAGIDTVWREPIKAP
jgi:streptogramin lyase